MKQVFAVICCAVLVACGQPPQLDVQAFAFRDGVEVALAPSGEGVFQTTAPEVRLVITVANALPWEEPTVTVATTAALDRVALMETKETAGRSVRSQLLDAQPVLTDTSVGPAEVTLEAEHRCCSGSMWRVDASAPGFGLQERFIVWAHDAPGDTIEGD